LDFGIWRISFAFLVVCLAAGLLVIGIWYLDFWKLVIKVVGFFGNFCLWDLKSVPGFTKLGILKHRFNYFLVAEEFLSK
jgi:hypothetical protein